MATPFPSSRSLLDGEAGPIEIVVHQSEQLPARAVAVVAHPHPLFGGTMDNKVVTTLARAFFDGGAATYRFNFRSVGASAGAHDEGRGETADMLQVIAHAQRAHPGLPLWLSGFSFGGAVTLAASEQVACSEMVLVAPAFSRLAHWANVQTGGNPPDTAIIIHGENDETVPLAASLDWARPRNIPIIVVPGADHFFHQRLHIIKRLAMRLATSA